MDRFSIQWNSVSMKFFGKSLLKIRFWRNYAIEFEFTWYIPSLSSLLKVSSFHFHIIKSIPWTYEYSKISYLVDNLWSCYKIELKSIICNSIEIKIRMQKKSRWNSVSFAQFNILTYRSNLGSISPIPYVLDNVLDVVCFGMNHQILLCFIFFCPKRSNLNLMFVFNIKFEMSRPNNKD